MNLSHPLNLEIEQSGDCDGKGARCMCDRLLEACSWSAIPAGEIKDCAGDDGDCRESCEAKHLGSLDEKTKKAVMSGKTWSMSRDMRRVGKEYSSCKAACRSTRRACDNSNFSKKLEGGRWKPEGCLEAARELSDPVKNGGSSGRRYACPERLAGKRVQKS